MSKTKIKWKLSKINSLVRLDRKIEIKADEWSHIVTQKTADLDIPFDSENPSRPQLIFNEIEGGSFFIFYTVEDQMISIHLDYNEPVVEDANKYISDFCNIVSALCKNFLSGLVADITLNISLNDYVSSSQEGLLRICDELSCSGMLDENTKSIEMNLESEIKVDHLKTMNQKFNYSNDQIVIINLEDDSNNPSKQDALLLQIKLQIDNQEDGLISHNEYLELLRDRMIVLVKELENE